jgi:hypothetical protein
MGANIVVTPSIKWSIVETDQPQPKPGAQSELESDFGGLTTEDYLVDLSRPLRWFATIKSVCIEKKGRYMEIGLGFR